MSALMEARDLLRSLAEPAPAGAHIKGLIRIASRLADISFGRATAIWYGDERVVIRAEEMDALRRAVAQQKRQEVAKRAGKENDSAGNDLRELVERIDGLERTISALLENVDGHSGFADWVQAQFPWARSG